jgi:hypothetical protein
MLAAVTLLTRQQAAAPARTLTRRLAQLSPVQYQLQQARLLSAQLHVLRQDALRPALRAQ